MKFRAVVLTFVLFCLFGCGRSGPLYLPNAPEQNQNADNQNTPSEDAQPESGN